MGTLFLSYAAADRARARELADGLGWAGHTVRMDDQLVGDLGWWVGVLAAVEGADAFLFARSASSLASPACVAEREYAIALGLPIVVVALESPDAGDFDVDFSTPDPAAAFRLVGRVAALPGRSFVAGWQPHPASPFERLADLAREVRAPAIGRDDQLRLADRLRNAVERGDAPDAARELAAILRNRDDLDPAAADRLDVTFPRGSAPRPTVPAATGQAAMGPAATGSAATGPAAMGAAAASGSAATTGPAWAAGPPGPPAGTLTEQAVRDVAFGRPAFNRRGYDEQSVDEFLDLVEADLQTRRAACVEAAQPGGRVLVNLTPADVQGVAFVRPPFGRRGYDERDVDHFLDEVERSFVVLDAELQRRGSRIAKR